MPYKAERKCFAFDKHFVFARVLDRRVKIERCQTPAIWCLLRATPILLAWAESKLPKLHQFAPRQPKMTRAEEKLKNIKTSLCAKSAKIWRRSVDFWDSAARWLNFGFGRFPNCSKFVFHSLKASAKFARQAVSRLLSIQLYHNFGEFSSDFNNFL